jgi:hypothetical protein
MQPTSIRRALLFFALLLAFGTSLVSVRAYLLQPHSPPPAARPTNCPASSHPANLLIIYPTVTPDGTDTLSLNIPGPILVVPPPCPAP